jgi:dTDP-4-dehydrorhamnose reductase
MRILLFGRNGQLGWELQRSLAGQVEIIAIDKEDLDLTKVDQIPILIDKVHPNVIINAAAYTNVDQAELEPELAYVLNAEVPEIMAESAWRMKCWFIHYSTDYVFDGKKGAAYCEKDTANPINVYGKSKLAGEEAIQAVGGSYFIFRTSWLYSLRLSSFPTKVLQWARENKVIRIVDDQFGSPTWSRMLAENTTLLLNAAKVSGSEWLTKRSGLYHVAGRGITNRFEWAKSIIALDPSKKEQIVEEIQPARTEEFPTLAERPRFTALDCNQFQDTFGIPLSDWASTLAQAMAEKK